MQIAEYLSGLIRPWLVTVIVSMIPVIELRGAIPIGVGLGMTPPAALGVSIVGNLIPVPFILLFIKAIFHWMREHMPKLGGLVLRMEAKAEKHRDTVLKWKFWGLVILVAVPLPGTGAWTGSLVAALMDMKLKKAFPAIALGVLIAGIIVTSVTYGFVSVL